MNTALQWVYKWFSPECPAGPIIGGIFFACLFVTIIALIAPVAIRVVIPAYIFWWHLWLP